LLGLVRRQTSVDLFLIWAELRLTCRASPVLAARLGILLRFTASAE
jgi:hypothetical protein